MIAAWRVEACRMNKMSGANTKRLVKTEYFFFSSRRRHTRFDCDWSSDVCSSDLAAPAEPPGGPAVSADYQRQAHHRAGRAAWRSQHHSQRRHLQLAEQIADVIGQIGRASCRERV